MQPFNTDQKAKFSHPFLCQRGRATESNEQVFEIEGDDFGWGNERGGLSTERGFNVFRSHIQPMHP